MFVVRDAGNTVDPMALGSLEYAIAHLGVPLVVVLGHQKCGAVSAAVSVVKEGASLPAGIMPVVEPILPAVLKAQSQPGDLLENAIRENVRQVVDRLRSSPDPIVKEPLAAGRLRVVGAHYALESGEVTWLPAS